MRTARTSTFLQTRLPVVRRRVDELQHQRASRHDPRTAGQEVPTNQRLQHRTFARALKITASQSVNISSTTGLEGVLQLFVVAK